MANKQPANKGANIRALYGEVHKFTQNGEFDKAIKSLNKSKFHFHGQFLRRIEPMAWKNVKTSTNSLIWPLIILKSSGTVLNVAADDTTASHCKAVCLIQASKFTEAVQFIDKFRLSGLVFEKAYAEYRLNDSVKALKTIDSAGLPGPLPPKVKELRAQILYRLERYEECFDMYRDIIKNTDDEYEEERTTNLSAVVANLAIEGAVNLASLPLVRVFFFFHRQFS